MARGRKKQQELTTLEAYKNEIIRLTMLEKAAEKSLNSIREQITIFKEKIAQEEHKQLMELMEERGLTFDEVKSMITNIGKKESITENTEEDIADQNIDE